MNPVKRIVTAALLATMMAMPIVVIPQDEALGADWNRPSRIHKNDRGWAAMYDVPRVTNYPKAWLRHGSAFYMDCWVDNYNGMWNGSPRWFAGYGGGYYGYVHSSYVTNQIWVPRC